MAEVTDAERTKVVDLRRAGVSIANIVKRVELPIDQVAAIIDEYLAEIRTTSDPRLELDRLDRMHAGIWPAAASGDAAAIDRAIRIQERRDKLERFAKATSKGDLGAAFEETVAATDTTGADAALIQAGRTIADRVDQAILTGEGQEVTKALYLMPHLVNVLRELSATPSSRAEHGDGARKLEAVPGGKKISDIRAKYRSASGQ